MIQCPAVWPSLAPSPSRKSKADWHHGAARARRTHKAARVSSCTRTHAEHTQLLGGAGNGPHKSENYGPQGPIQPLTLPLPSANQRHLTARDAPSGAFQPPKALPVPSGTPLLSPSVLIASSAPGKAGKREDLPWTPSGSVLSWFRALDHMGIFLRTGGKPEHMHPTTARVPDGTRSL